MDINLHSIQTNIICAFETYCDRRWS